MMRVRSARRKPSACSKNRCVSVDVVAVEHDVGEPDRPVLDVARRRHGAASPCTISKTRPSRIAHDEAVAAGRVVERLARPRHHRRRRHRASAMRVERVALARAQRDVTNLRRVALACSDKQVMVGAGAAQVQGTAVTGWRRRGARRRCRTLRARARSGTSRATLRSAAIVGELMACSARRMPRKDSALRWISERRRRRRSRPRHALDRRLLVEVERIVAAEHQLRGAEGRDQRAQQRRIEHQRVVEEAARLLGRGGLHRLGERGEHAPALLQARQQRSERAAAVAEGDAQARPAHHRLPVITEAAARPTSVG